MGGSPSSEGLGEPQALPWAVVAAAPVSTGLRSHGATGSLLSMVTLFPDMPVSMATLLGWLTGPLPPCHHCLWLASSESIWLSRMTWPHFQGPTGNLALKVTLP